MYNFKLIQESIDLDGVGRINVSWDFDDDEYQEWLVDNGYENNDEILTEYIEDNVEFELEFFDNETYHHMSFDTCYYDDLVNEFGESMAQRILNDIKKNGESSFETQEIYNAQPFDVNNPNELNNVAMKILNHGGYYKGCRGFILTNGVIVYTPLEHNMVSQIDGIKGTFDFIKRGNIRILNQSIDLSKPPTQEQREVLRQVITSYSNEVLYVDILTEKDGQSSSYYEKPNWRYVMGEIDRYFSEGIRPQGGMIRESVSRGFENVRLVGEPDDIYVIVNNIKVADYFYTDSKAYPFFIAKGKVFIGESGETHGQIKLRSKLLVSELTETVDGRIWVRAKSNEFNYVIVVFWGTSKTNENYKPYVEEVVRKLKVNPLKVVIASQLKSSPYDDNNNMMMSQPILLQDWNGTIHQLTNMEQEKKNLHMMNAMDKHNNTDEFRKSRDKKIGKKLTNDKGEEMPMAKYHSLIYQENAKHKKIILSERQFKKIFKE